MTHALFWIGFGCGAGATVVLGLVLYLVAENLAFRNYWGP